MAQRNQGCERVLVIDADARVRAALAALIDGTPGLRVVATTGSTADAGSIACSTRATVVVVDLDAGQRDDDFAVIGQLAGQLPVVAICYAGSSDARAVAAGATALCDKSGDPDALTAAVTAVARHRSMPEPTGTEAAPTRARGRR
jgi:DNA-binding NarL/FixJ family response regulator